MGLFAAAGRKDVTLALLYSSGCPVKRHWEWFEAGEKKYQYRVYDPSGFHVTENFGLADALSETKWDVVSFDNNARSFASGRMETALSLTEPYFEKLFSAIRERVGDARYLWHEVWANEIGYHLAFEMKTKEQRTQVYRAKHDLMHHMIKTYGVGGVPTGDAWELVRDLPLFCTPLPSFPEVERFSLCSRLRKGAFYDDFTHDGDVGGGRYLNACVWFEILTGQSCLGSLYRPRYEWEGRDVSLSEEKIIILQQAAHRAVEEHYKKAGK